MFRLPEHDRLQLLSIARNSVQADLSRTEFQLPQTDSGILTQQLGVFVTLHKGPLLRGCIGNVMPETSLLDTTARCAVAAATSDPRFPRVTLNELPEIHFEISVLTPPELMNDPEEIEIGKHGLIVSRGSARGLLLPQVAIQHSWGRYAFLAETCIKAGLPEDTWKFGADTYIFTAEVFAENDIHQPVKS